MKEVLKNESSIAKKKDRIDFSKLSHIAFKFMYMGKNYEGLVIQSHTDKTVEAQLFKALKRCKLVEDLPDEELMKKYNYSRCGRTDAGVSSTGNVFNINLRHKEGFDYIKTINNLLPNDIMIIGQSEVDDTFDARFSCLYREYKYMFLRGNMNISKMIEAAVLLEGVHNFKNFCKIDKSDTNYQTKNYNRRIFEFKIEPYQNFIFPSSSSNIITITSPYYEPYIATIKGSAFLWHQVRCMMGILFLIGKNLEDVSIINEMLDESGTDKKFIYEIASDANLVLSDCHYEFINFPNTEENIAGTFFKMESLYQQNLTQMAINSFFFRTINSQIPALQESESRNENDMVEYYESKHRKHNKYTQMLNHKTNRKKK